MDDAQPIRVRFESNDVIRKQLDQELDEIERPIDFDALISDSTSEYQLLDVCGRIASHFDLPHFLIMNLPSAEDHKLSDLDLVSNWPEFLIAAYDTNNLLDHSPIISNLRKSTAPLVYDVDSINKGREDGNAQLAAELFKSFGINSGVYFSVHMANGQLGAVSFSGSGEAPDHKKIVQLNYLSNLIYSKINLLRNRDKKPDFDLKKNEINCLKWTSQGKTSWEIASIVGLSEHTVNHYLTSAAQKLDTSNRTHAVSKAIRLKIIS